MNSINILVVDDEIEICNLIKSALKKQGYAVTVRNNAIDIIIVHPDCEKINPYYLCYFTNMPHGKKQINEGTSGAAQQHFNVGKYNKLRLMLPPKELQDEFADLVHQIDKSKVNYYYKNRKDGFPPLLFIYSVTTIINLSDY